MKSKFINSRYIIVWFVVLFSILFFYILLRSNNLSFTFDESVSYKIIKGDTIYANTANNHYLNTCLMSASGKVFGEDEFSLRLPNALAFILYFTGGFLILRDIKKFWLIIAGSCLLFFHPYLLDFFSLARGYGLSAGFMMMSLYFLLKDREDNSLKFLIKDFIFALIFASASLASNLSFLNFYFAILIIFIFQYLIILKKINSVVWLHAIMICLLLLSLIPVYLAAIRLLMLSKLDQLYFGETNLLDSLKSLICRSFYFSPLVSWKLTLIQSSIIITFIFGYGWICYQKDFSNKPGKILFLLLLVLTGQILEHIVFNSKYPTGRTALNFIPVFGLFVLFLLESLDRSSEIKKIIIPSLTFLFIVLPLSLNLFSNVNLKHFDDWSYDSKTKEIMNLIEKFSRNSNHNLTISNPWLLEPAINYYITSKNLKINPANWGGVNDSSDFIYTFGLPPKNNNYSLVRVFVDSRDTIVFCKRNNLITAKAF